MTRRKVGIVGSRDFPDLQMVWDLVMVLPEGTIVVSGGAKGVDSVAVQAAKARGLSYIEHLPDYKRYGKEAPWIRNSLIVQDSDFLIAFWDGKSTGTVDAIRKAHKKGIPVRKFLPPGAT